MTMHVINEGRDSIRYGLRKPRAPNFAFGAQRNGQRFSGT
jgi:hypothetical protein